MTTVDAIRVPMSKPMSEVTLQLKMTGVRTARARLWLAGMIFRFGAWVAGCGIEMSDGEPDFDRQPRHGYRTYEDVDGILVPRCSSVDRSSPIYDPNSAEYGPKVDVLLDGMTQQHVVAFDMDQGAVRVHVLDSGGLTEVRRGAVTLAIRA